MANLTHTPRNFGQADKALGARNTRVIGNNTKLERRGGSIFATLHGNDIVEYTEDVTFATWAGYASSTTRDRLNQLTNATFNIKNFTPHMNGQPVGAYERYEV